MVNIDARNHDKIEAKIKFVSWVEDILSSTKIDTNDFQKCYFPSPFVKNKMTRFYGIFKFRIFSDQFSVLFIKSITWCNCE